MHKARHEGGPIGAHTGVRQPESRLGQHSCLQNKDRSIFRKNIGHRYLHRAQYPYGQDRPEKSSSEGQFAPKRNLQNHISFALFRIAEKEERLRLESRIIPTVSLCPACRPSGSWLGLHSPKEKTRRSGLWQVNELGKTPLIPADLELLSGSILK